MSEVLARRYARAFFDLAGEAGDIAGRGAQLSTAATALADPQVARTLANPRVGVPDRVALVLSLESLSTEVRNLLRLLVEGGRIELLPGIVDNYRRLADRASGVVRVEVTTAIPVNGEFHSTLDQKLGERLKRDVHTEIREDPEILGGLVIRIGDRVIDNSVRTHLERLRAALA